MIKPVFVVAFTGNRPLNQHGRRITDLQTMKPRMVQALRSFVSHAESVNAEIHLLTGAAAGADIVACQAAYDLNIPVHVLLPMSIERFMQHFGDFPELWNDSLEQITNAKNGVNGGTLRFTCGSEDEDACYAESNFHMLDAADALLALTNGKGTGKLGGAHDMLELANNRNIPSYHINTLGNSDSETEEQKATLSSFQQKISCQENLNVFDRLEEHIQAANVGSNTAQCEELFGALDEASIKLKRKIRLGLKASIWLHGTASLLAALGVSYALADGPYPKEMLIAASAVEFLLIAWAEFIHWKHHKKHTAEAWMECRFAAELMRPLRFLTTRFCPLSPLVSHHYDYWRRYCQSVYLHVTACPSAKTDQDNLKTLKETYLTERIKDQISHFENERDKAKPPSDRYYNWVRTFSLSALGVVAIAVYYKLDHYLQPGGHHSAISACGEFMLYFLPIALPLFAGILSALRTTLDVSRRSLRYEHMINLLKESIPRIESAPTLASFTSAMMRVEESLLDELNEFYIAQKIGTKH